jgi:hypothetical protein
MSVSRADFMGRWSLFLLFFLTLGICLVAPRGVRACPS